MRRSASFSTSRLSRQAKQQAFAQALATNTQSMRNFWRTLGDGQHGLTAAEASAIERTLSVGAFVKNLRAAGAEPGAGIFRRNL